MDLNLLFMKDVVKSVGYGKDIMDDKKKSPESLSGSGSPEIENQCEATFTFAISLPDNPYITFRCMREKHDDGRHEHRGMNRHGWEYRIAWDEPIQALIGAIEELFAGKASKVVQ